MWITPYSELQRRVANLPSRRETGSAHPWRRRMNKYLIEDEARSADYSLVVESTTALQHGAGGDPFRWVSGLTPSEREAVRTGTATVFFMTTEYSGHYSQSGFKVVKPPYNNTYGFREPTALEMDIILSLTTNSKRHEWSTNGWKCIRCGESAKNIRVTTKNIPHRPHLPVRESRVNAIYWRDWQRSAKPGE